MKEVYSVVNIHDEVEFKFFAIYHYAGNKIMHNLKLTLKDFDIAINKSTKRCTLIPEIEYAIEFETNDSIKEFIENECKKTFKVDPKVLFRYLISKSIYHYIGKLNVFKQITFERNDDNLESDLSLSIRRKNESCTGLSWSTMTSVKGMYRYEACEKRDLFSEYNPAIIELELDSDHLFDMPKDLIRYCGKEPDQLEFNFDFDEK